MIVCGVLLVGAGFGQDFRLVAMESRVVPVTGLKMTNLVFPGPVAAGVKVSRDVLVQRPRGIDNVIELKAVRRNFPETNLSVFGKDGRLYSFVLRYAEDSAVLNFRVVADTAREPVLLSGWPVAGAVLDRDAAGLSARRGFMRAAVHSGGMGLRLKGIYLRDGLMWFCFLVHNGSRIGFTPAYMRCSMEDGRQVKRKASQELDLVPVYGEAPGFVPGEDSRIVALAFTPFALARGKRMVVTLGDASGGRNLELVVKRKVVLRGR